MGKRQREDDKAVNDHPRQLDQCRDDHTVKVGVFVFSKDTGR